ncbi:Metallo-dependent hydrolase [Coprinellus micaceus]|uniref:Metallo-dependent hydrolase n=1 Tax=Coprinellus micaceus TaxID=71717 RepID=A0A4Y7SQV9_COPMI|nr:Metallo-dependent hydrolase [Coprinellus micaceus]
MVLLLRGSFIEARPLGDLKMHHDHLLVVDEDGIIEHFDDATIPVSASLIASRTHRGETVTTTPPGSFISPRNGLDLPLLEWLDRYTYKAEERLDSDPALAKRVYDRLGRRLVENGTGAVSLFGDKERNKGPSHSVQSHILARSMLDAGVRARIGKLSMDISTRPTASLEGAEAFAADCCILTRGIASGQAIARTLQAHCTYLAPPDLVRVAQRGTSVAHCPLSNIYFSARPFPLREALRTGVESWAGHGHLRGVTVQTLWNAMRNAVAVSRMREGERVSTSSHSTNAALFALGFGIPFDAQQICLAALDFFDLESGHERSAITIDMVEKWWCIGDTRNRKKVWVQGAEILSN